MTEEISKDVTWNEDLEAYFVKTGERSFGLSWLHKKAEEQFTLRKTPLELGTIIIGAVNGFISVGSNQIFSGWSYSSIIIGLVSLFVSVLNTIQSYYSYGKRCEAHRIASIQYSKLYRYLSIEMSLPRDQRVSPHDLLKFTRDSYDRLNEIQPLVPNNIIQAFTEKFKDAKGICVPEEVNGLEKIHVFHDKPLILDTPVIDARARDPANTERRASRGQEIPEAPPS
jgi:hypothetical protein